MGCIHNNWCLICGTGMSFDNAGGKLGLMHGFVFIVDFLD